MASTRGQDEPIIVTPVSERVAGVIAGQGVVRRVVLYVVLFAALGCAFYAPVCVVPALVAAVLLMATDGGLA